MAIFPVSQGQIKDFFSVKMIAHDYITVNK